MSTILWMCSMLTGHPSSHHPHDVHPHTASSVATCVIMSGPFHAGASAPSPSLPLAFAASKKGALSSKCSRCSITRYLGLTVLPVATVGQLIVHRRHSSHDPI